MYDTLLTLENVGCSITMKTKGLSCHRDTARRFMSSEMFFLHVKLTEIILR